MMFRTGKDDGISTRLSVDVVEGHGNYACPNIASVDQHLSMLRNYIAKAALPQMRSQMWEDVDLLLERRLWLEEMEALSGSPQE